MTAPDISPTLAAALAFGARGWPVFPCRPNNETVTIKGVAKDYTKSSPLIAKGLLNASVDPAQINAWWKRWPAAMIGLPLGGATGIFALDFDPREDPETGEVWTLERLRRETEEQLGVKLPRSACAMTPSGGVHLFFQMPSDGGAEIRNRGNLPDHVDVRAAGGYVVAAPSIRFDGVYKWLRDIETTPVAEAPAELIAELRAPKRPRTGGAGATGYRVDGRDVPAPPAADTAEKASAAVRSYAMAAFDAECRELEATREGGRNNQLNRSAFALGQLVGAGAISYAVARGALTGIAAKWGEFDKSEGTIDSGLNAGMAQPRDLAPIEAEAAERAARYGSGGRRRPTPLAASSARPGALAPDAPRGTSAPSAPADPSFGDTAAAAGSPHPSQGGEEKTSRMGALRGSKQNPGPGGIERAGAMTAQTDLGNAERWFMRYGEAFRWCSALGWLAWDGRRWKPTDSAVGQLPAEVLLSVYNTVRAIGDEADWLAAEGVAWRARFGGEDSDEPIGPGDFRSDPDLVVEIKKDKRIRKSDRLRAWARASESAGRLTCIANIAKPWVSVSEAAFDADPLRFNVNNGTIRLWREVDDAGLRVGRFVLGAHDRRDMMTKLAPIDFDPDALSPQWDRFLERVQPDAPMRRFIHAWFGYSLTGDTSAQKLVFNYGMGANGKSVSVDTVAYIAGDYGRSVGIETFLDQGTKRKGGDATPDLANLKGVRMVRTSEPERGAKFAEALIKLATGGEPISVRHNYGTFFDLIVAFKLTISGNHKPTIGTDDGIWRRFQLVPWEVTIPEAERDPDLTVKLRAEASGILNRLLAGAVDWLEAGLPVPTAIVEATQNYRTMSDPVARFLALCVTPAAGERVQSMTLHKVYAAWCAYVGERVWSPKALTSAISEKGYRQAKSSAMYWQDIRLDKVEEDFVDSQGKPLADPDLAGPRGADGAAHAGGAAAVPIEEPEYGGGEYSTPAAAEPVPAPPAQRDWSYPPDWAGSFEAAAYKEAKRKGYRGTPRDWLERSD